MAIAAMLKSPGKFRRKLFLFWCVVGAMTAVALAQQRPAEPASPPPEKGSSEISKASPPLNIPEIIRRFAAKEKQFKAARDNYTYRQVVKIQELTPDGDVTGTYEMKSDIIFTPNGQRIEKIVYAPPSTLHRISLSPEDETDLRSIQPFVLTTDNLPEYNIQYLGRQRVDELTTYVFNVWPKKIEKGQRYFEGQVWVDDQDLQIVKTYGKAVPDIRKKGNENLFPRFETYRQQIDGKYWFPTWTGADDTLNFSTGPQRIRMIIRYENYKQFRSNVKITYGGETSDQKSKP